MAATPAQASHRSAASVWIDVSGGRPTESGRTPQTSDADFAAALRRSIAQSGLFARTATAPSADYRLLAYIGRLDHPLMGLAVHVEMEVDYQLIQAATDRPLWHKSIRSQHTAPSDQAFGFVDRVRLGNEAVARMNIEQMMHDVAELKLP